MSLPNDLPGHQQRLGPGEDHCEAKIEAPKRRYWLSKRRKAGAGIRDVVEPLLDCLNNDRLPHEHIFYEYIRRAALNLNRKSLADARWGTPPLPLPLHAYTSKR